jgi:hypothetical protein
MVPPMSAVKKTNPLAFSEFADGNFHGERAIAALRGKNIGVVGKTNAEGNEQTVSTVDAALIIELLKSGKDEDLRAVADLLVNAKKLPQGSLQELLRLMMLRGVGSFEQDWLDLIPDGIYTLDGRKQVEWIARTIHMLLLVQQQQQALFPGMAVPVAVNQSFQRLAQMESQMHHVLRHSEPAQVQAGMHALVADPQNRTAIIAVRDFMRQNPTLIDAVAYQKMAITVATPWLHDLAQASQQFQAAAAELARSGKLNPAAQSALALTQPALAQMMAMARDIPGVSPAKLSPAAVQMLAGLQRVDNILLAVQQTPLSPSMQRAIENLSVQINAALMTPLRDGTVLRTDNPIILNLNMAARNDLLATPLLDANGKRIDPANIMARPLETQTRDNPVRDVIARIDANGLTPLLRENMTARAMVNDPWANVIPLPVARNDTAAPSTYAPATVPLSYQNPIATLGRAANDDRPGTAAVYQPPVVAINGGMRAQQEPESRRVVLSGATTQFDNSGIANNPVPASGSVVRGDTATQNGVEVRVGAAAPVADNGNISSAIGSAAASTQTQPQIQTNGVGTAAGGAGTANPAENAGTGQGGKAAEASAPPQPGIPPKPMDSRPPDQPPAPPIVEQNKKTEYKPSEKIGGAALKPKEPGEHICGPNCSCGKVIGEKVVSTTRRPPKLDLTATVNTTEPAKSSKCDGCNGEKGCCPGKGKPLSSNGGAHIPTQNAEPSLNAAATGTGVVEFENNSSPGRVYDFINANTKGRHAA